MVKQRLIQDYQLVSEKSVGTELQRGGEAHAVRNDRSPTRKKKTGSSPMEIYVSMGHKTQELSLHNDVIKVKIFSESAEDDQEYTYSYMLWLPSTKSYDRVTIKFKKFAEEYGWNNLDLLLHSENMVLRENHRYRRISYRIIPTDYRVPGSGNENLEKLYKEKMEKLIMYLSRSLIKKDLNVTFKTRSDTHSDKKNSQWFKVAIEKKTLNLEWMQICVDTVYYTDQTFGLVFGWLVASAHHIERNITLIQNRCNDFGLDFICVPQTSLNSNMYLNPFLRPEKVDIECPNEGVYSKIENSLYHEHGFINDGFIFVKKEDVEGRFNENTEVYRFVEGKRKICAQQYMHLSGIMFIRVLRKKNGGATYLFLENRKLQTSKSSDKAPDAEVIFRKVKSSILQHGTPPKFQSTRRGNRREKKSSENDEYKLLVQKLLARKFTLEDNALNKNPIERVMIAAQKELTLPVKPSEERKKALLRIIKGLSEKDPFITSVVENEMKEPERWKSVKALEHTVDISCNNED